jgi:hypothetical protein
MQTFNLQNSLFNTPDDKRHLVYFTGEGEPIKGGLGQDEIEEYKAELKSIEDKDRDLQTRVTEFQALTEELIEDIEELQFLLQDEVDESGFLKTEVEEGVGTELYGDSERLGLDEDDIQILKIAKGRVEDARTVSLAEQDIVGGTAYVSEALENLLGIEFTVALEDWEYSPEATTSFEKEYEKVGDLDSSKLSEIQIEQSIEDGGMTLFNEKGYEFTVPVPFRRAGEDPPYTLQTRSGEIKRTSQAGREKLISEGHGADSEPYKHYEYLIPVEYGGHDLYLPIGYITSGSRDALNSVMTRTAEPVADPAPEPVVAPTESDKEPDAVATADGSSIAFGSSMADAEAVDPAAEEPPTDEAEDPGDGVVEGESREEALARERAEEAERQLATEERREREREERLAREAAETPIEYFAFELPTFTKTLRPGDKGSEVKQLQVYLNQLSGKHKIFADVKIADSGFGSPGSETENYEELTIAAVTNLQTALYVLGYYITDSEGEFGETTQRVLRDMQISEERFAQAESDPGAFLSEIVLPDQVPLASIEEVKQYLEGPLLRANPYVEFEGHSHESLNLIDDQLAVIEGAYPNLADLIPEFRQYKLLRAATEISNPAKLKIVQNRKMYFTVSPEGKTIVNLRGDTIEFDSVELMLAQPSEDIRMILKIGDREVVIMGADIDALHASAVAANLIEGPPTSDDEVVVADADDETPESDDEAGADPSDETAGEGEEAVADEASEAPEMAPEDVLLASLEEDLYSTQLEAELNTLIDGADTSEQEIDIIAGMVDGGIDEIIESSDSSDEARNIAFALRTIFNGEQVSGGGLPEGLPEPTPPRKFTSDDKLAYLAQPEAKKALGHFPPELQSEVERVARKQAITETEGRPREWSILQNVEGIEEGLAYSAVWMGEDWIPEALMGYYFTLVSGGKEKLAQEIAKSFDTTEDEEIRSKVAKPFEDALAQSLMDALGGMAIDPRTLLANEDLIAQIEGNGVDGVLESAIRSPELFELMGGGVGRPLVIAVPKTDEDGNIIPDAAPEFLFIEQEKEREVVAAEIDAQIDEIAGDESKDQEARDVAAALKTVFGGAQPGLPYPKGVTDSGISSGTPLTPKQKIAYLAKPESEPALKHLSPGIQEAVRKVGAKIEEGEEDRLVLVVEGAKDGELIDRVVTGKRGAYDLIADVTGKEAVRAMKDAPPEIKDKIVVDMIKKGMPDEDALADDATTDEPAEEAEAEPTVMFASYKTASTHPTGPKGALGTIQTTLYNEQIEARTVILEDRIFSSPNIIHPNKEYVPRQIFEKNQMSDLLDFHDTVNLLLHTSLDKRGPRKVDWQKAYKRLYKNATGKEQKGFLTLGGNPLALYQVIKKALRINEKEGLNANDAHTGAEFIGSMAARQWSIDNDKLSDQGIFDAVTLMSPEPLGWSEMEMYLSDKGMPIEDGPVTRAFAIFPNGKRPGENPLYIKVERHTDKQYIARYGSEASTHDNDGALINDFLNGEVKRLLGGRELDDITIYEISPESIEPNELISTYREFQSATGTVEAVDKKIEQQVDRFMVRIASKAGIAGPHIEKARRVRKVLEKYGTNVNLQAALRASVESGKYREGKGELANKMEKDIAWAYFEACGYEPSEKNGEFDLGGGTRTVERHHSPLETLRQMAVEKVAAGEASIDERRQVTSEKEPPSRSQGSESAEGFEGLAYSPGDILDRATFTPKVKRAARGIYKDFLRKLSIGLTVNQAREVLEAGSLSALPGLPIKKRAHAEQLLMAVERMGEYVAKPDVRRGWHGLKRGEAAIFINGESPLHNLMRIAMYSAYGQVGTRRGIPGFADRVADIGLQKQPKKTCARPVRYRSRYDLPNVRRWS